MKKIIPCIFILVPAVALSQIQEGVKAPPTEQSLRQELSDDSTVAEFPGGLTALRTVIGNKINTRKIKAAKGRITSKAKFAININGEIEELTVTGDNESLNQELAKVIKSLKMKWKPGTYKNNPVKTWFIFPLHMNFE